MREHLLDLDVERDFGGFRLRVNHRIRLDGITALFGHSGCGKSTLLRIISGLDRGAVGRVAFGGEAWQDSSREQFVAAEKRGVGYVFQDARLFPHLDVRGNLCFAERRSRRFARTPTFDDVVSALGVAPLLTQSVGSLSGGEAQRVAIARTLLTRPRLLLLDEPLSALDGKRKSEILPYIAALPKHFGIPVIHVTHSVDEVAQLAERIVVLSKGEVAAVGQVPEVFARLDLGPVTGRFEAGVTLDVLIVGQDETFRMTKLDFRGQPILIPRIEGTVGSTVRLRLRARDVSLATELHPGISIRNQLRGSIREISNEPDTAFAEVLVDIAGSPVRARVTRHAVHELDLAPGTAVVALIKSVALDRTAPPA